MSIIVFYRISFEKIRYDLCIDHDQEDVIYIGSKGARTDIPATLRHRWIDRDRFDALDDISELAGAQPISHIIALSEYDLATAASWRQKLGLPGPGIETIRNVTDKLVMKACVKAAGIRVPNFQSAQEFLRDPLKTDQGYIIKPVKGAASVGVVHAADLQTALSELAHRKAESGLDDIEVEEFIGGPILHFDGLVVKDDIIALTKNSYLGTCLGFAESAPLGSVSQQLSDGDHAWVSRCLKALNLDDGVFHLEAIASPQGLVFLEIANRAGGAGVVEVFQCATGINLLHANAALQSETFDLKKQIHDDKRSPQGYQCFGWFVYPGFRQVKMRYASSILDHLRKDPRALRFTLNYPFQVVTSHVSYQEHEIPLSGIVGAKTLAETQDYIEKVFQNIAIDFVNEEAVA